MILSEQGEEAHLRLLHTLDKAPAAAADLLEQAEALLRHGETQRITGSLPLSPQDPLLQVLRQQGYRATPRARLILDLTAADIALPQLPGYRLVPWQADYQDAAAALLEMAHRDSADIALHPEFAELEGIQRLFRTVFAGRYGRFDPDQVWMALVDEQLVGLALNVWHAVLPTQGFILDLAVTPAHRRRGLGRALVLTTARAFREAGAPYLGLAVTLANRPAVALYQGLGFQVEQYFSVVGKALPSG
jgi:ribosomal protein S18 acetylase RimI-like enzyme